MTLTDSEIFPANGIQTKLNIIKEKKEGKEANVKLFSFWGF